MIKKIKKHFNKILIACLTLISSIAIFTSINKTYAYESNQFTYTLDLYSDSNYTTPYNLTNFQTTTILVNNCIVMDSNTDIYFNIKNTNNNTQINKYYLLVNFYLLNSSNQITYSNNERFRVSYMPDSTFYEMNLRGNIADYNNNNLFTFIGNKNVSTNYFFSNNTKYFTFYIPTNYKIVITNIDFVTPIDIGLQQYYDTYYGQIEDNYNQLLSDYNDLQDNYDSLQTNYDTLEDNYNDLQEQYQTTEQENLENQLYNQYGDLYNCSMQIDQTINGTTTSHTLSFNDMITNNIISNSYLYYNNAFNYLNIDTSDGFTTTTLNLAKPINTSNLNWIYKNENISGITFELEYIDTNQETLQVSFAAEQATPIQLNTDLLLTKQLGNININNLYFDQFILSFNYATTNQVWISINTTNASIYNNGYNNGYRQAYNEQKETYEPIINNLRNNITSVENQLNTLQSQYNDLIERYNRLDSNDNSLYAMVVSIADTPLRIFKQIFNFDVLGINISTITMSIVSLLIIIWLIKKIF